MTLDLNGPAAPIGHEALAPQRKIIKGNTMIIRDLKAGDHFTQEIRGEQIQFKVLAVETIGRQVQVELESRLGRASARYMGHAYLPGTRSRNGRASSLN
jgi:hypothetical protein